MDKKLLKEGEITFVCISDTHSKTNKLKYPIPPGDVLLHAGDFSMLGMPEEIIKFNEFIKSLNFQYKIVIAGNHELTFDEEGWEKNGLKDIFAKRSENNKEINPREVKSFLKDCIYLEDTSINVFGYNIYGSPWITIYDDWGFFLNDQNRKKKWEKIPADTDILLTHSPPFGIRDICLDNNLNEGCPFLLKEIKERIKPKYHVFGHVHEEYGITMKDEITFINCSTCDEFYKPVNNSITFTLPLKQ